MRSWWTQLPVSRTASVRRQWSAVRSTSAEGRTNPRRDTLRRRMDNDLMRAVDIRLPGMTRALYIAYFGLIGAIALLVGSVATKKGSAVALLVAVPIAGLGTLAATRFSMLAVTVEGETLQVRNILATRRIR